jgi:anti-sigma factor RsiW
MKSRFDELLPFYVNGTLNEADRAWVEEYLREHPTAGAELRWYESLQTKLREDLPPVSSEVGLERAMQRIHAERPAPARRDSGPNFIDRLRDFFSSITPQPLLRPALAGALARQPPLPARQPPWTQPTTLHGHRERSRTTQRGQPVH